MSAAQWTDETLCAELGTRLAHERLRRNWTQAELAHEAGVSKRTVERLEAGQSVQVSNLVRVLRSLGAAERMLQLLPQAGASPMEQLKAKERGATRQRARKARAPVPGEPWTWGDES